MSRFNLRKSAGPVMASIFVLGVVLAAGAVIAPFFVSILWGAIIAVAVWKPFGIVRRKVFRGHTQAAAAAAVVLMFTAAFSPFAVGAWGVYRKASDFSRTLAVSQAPSEEEAETDGSAQKAGRDIAGKTREKVQEIAVKAGEIPVIGEYISDFWESFSQKKIDFRGMAVKASAFVPDAAHIVVRVAKAMTGGVVMFAMSILFAGYFFTAGPVFAKLMRRLGVRIGGKSALGYIDQSVAAVRAVVYGFIGAAAAQGVTAFAGLAVAGVNHALLLGIIAGVFSVVPGGPALVGFFGAYQLYAGGSPAASLCLVAWFLIVVCNVDNLVKGIIIKRYGGSSLPFIIVFISVIGGAFAFGLLGVFIGPVIMTLLSSMIQTYLHSGGAAPAEKDGCDSVPPVAGDEAGVLPGCEGENKTEGKQTDPAS
ncbi:MAG: AI-2E family transporter [Succinivibrionaceae bacterium]|nr:AI-2E family transporter [Succinivibrionaceae bacterium]